MAASNRCIVGSDLHGGGSIGTEVEQTGSLVGTGTDYLGSILGNIIDD